jgi:hypothetical protein
METELARIHQGILAIGDRLLGLDAALVDLQAAVNVLKVYVATQLQPDDFVKGLEALEQIEKLARNEAADEARETTVEVVNALKQIEKHGEHEA